MQVSTSTTYSPQVNKGFLFGDFSAIAKKIEKKGNFTSLQPFINFRGQFVIGDFLLPTQEFAFRKKDDFIVIENFPTDSFPKIEILLNGEDSIFKTKDFKIRLSENTVQGEILYTRFLLMITELGRCSLHVKNIDLPALDFGFSKLPFQERKQILNRAKIFHKLGFLEDFFKVKFNLPEELDSKDVQQIEILFRGLIEGQFTTPMGRSVTIFNHKIRGEDLENLLISQKKSFSFEFNQDLLVIGKFFPVGKRIFRIDKAAIANPRSLRGNKIGDIIEQLRLIVFDYQVHHSFSKYLNPDRLLKNKQKLKQFKNELLKKEPEFLVNLLDEPFVEITAKAAIEIVTGWLQYYDFPDRYSVGEPILEGENWRVPILLTYPKEKSSWIEDAFVNLKTGVIEISSSPEKLRKKGKKKAEEVFSVA